MSMQYTRPTEQTAPPSSFANPLLTPPPTDKKPFAQAQQVIALFRDRQAGRHTKHGSWTEFQLAPGEYAEIERLLSQDEALSRHVKDKIRYDHDPESHRLVVRMPTGVHNLFIDRVEDAIRSQLKTIRSGSGNAARFATKVQPARSTEIYFPTATGSSMSKHEPDASFWHDDAQYPGVIIEVACSQKRKRLSRLAEDYLLDSDASVQVVVGLDIEYGMKETSKATFSTWRTQLFDTADGDELRVVEEIADQAFRDEQGNPTNHSGLQLQLFDFACDELTEHKFDSGVRKIIVPTQELCQYLMAAESTIRRQDALVKHDLVPGVRKRRRSEMPHEEMTSSDEARGESKRREQEERATKRTADDDLDYEVTSRPH